MKNESGMNLREIENRILALRDTEFEAVLEQGRVLGLAKQAFENEGEWVRWFAVERKIFSERHGQYLVNVAGWWDALALEIRAEMPRHWGKCRDLAMLSTDQLREFLRNYDALGMTREQVKNTVAAILDAAGRKERQLDFFATLRMPRLEKLVEAARDPSGAVCPERAADYAIVCASLAGRHADRLTDEQRRHYAREFFTAAQTLVGGDLHAVLESVSAGPRG